MKRSRWALLVGLFLCLIAVWVGGSRHVDTRLLAKDEHVRVFATGQWYHWYTIRLAGRDGRDTFTVAVGRALFDELRTGASVRTGVFAPFPRLTWIADSASIIRSLTQTLAAQMRRYNSPRSVSPLLVPTPGLARVVSVTSVERRPAFWERAENSADASSSWLHVIELEFWAPRTRGLVHAVDVIDAGSIPGLHPGDVLQMHFDARDPRTLRLDDGTRTYSGTRTSADTRRSSGTR